MFFIFAKNIINMKTLHVILSGIITISLFFIISCKDKNEDTTSPVITVNGNNPYTVRQGTTYSDPGATATDDTDGDITSKIVVINNVNTTDTGSYQVKYNVADNAGNAAEEKVRTVKVIFM